jgi:hypothetical protein
VDTDLTPMPSREFTELKQREYALWAGYAESLRAAT